jgi:chemotaxis response regulator CheB
MAVRVLIANSSGMEREVIRNHLECGGCQVVAETVTVAQTIDLIRTTRPDVITLDIGLRSAQSVDALSLLRTIRRESPGTSIMVVGASQSSDNQRIYGRRGTVERIAEPFDSFRLKRMWQRLSNIYPELKPSKQGASGRRI